jgi:peptidoglycan/LPS O-acetylase OafA/YrhL
MIKEAQLPAHTVAKEKNEGSNLFFLDGLRAIAATVVLVGHARWILWEGYSEGYVKHPEQYSFIGKLLVYFFSLFRYGHEAVLLFFVLSGFVIHLRYSRKLKRDPGASFDTGNYFVRRIRRIYPPFLFVLLFTFLIDALGMKMGLSIYFHTTPNELLNVNVKTDHSLVNLVGNLFFYQDNRIGVWGTDGPLWSLKYEWWFYMLYPLLFIANKKSVYIAAALVAGLFILSFVLYHPSVFFVTSVFGYLLSWWLGALLADIYTGRFAVKAQWVSVLTIMLPVCIVFSNRFTNDMIKDTSWAIGFTGLIALLLYAKEKGMRLRALEKLKWLGDCSYTLYIIHFPILVFFGGLVLKYNNNAMPQTFAFVVGAVVFVVALSWLLHFVIEKPFQTKR